MCPKSQGSCLAFPLTPSHAFRNCLKGEHGLLAYITHVLDVKGHCVICVAEGAAQELASEADGQRELDPSGEVD